MARPAKTFTEAEIDRCLTELAFHQGVAAPASRALKENHGISISPNKLIEWRDDTYVDRYERNREALVVRLAEEAEGLAHEYAAIERQVAARLRDSVDEIDPRDLAGTLRNVSTARGISLTNANVLRGRPTSITETRGAEDIMRALAYKLGVVDSTATEVTGELESGNE